MIGFDLSKSAKWPLICIRPKCYYVEDLLLDSVGVIAVFYCKFCAFRIIFFYEAFFKVFLSEKK